MKVVVQGSVGGHTSAHFLYFKIFLTAWRGAVPSPHPGVFAVYTPGAGRCRTLPDVSAAL